MSRKGCYETPSGKSERRAVLVAFDDGREPIYLPAAQIEVVESSATRLDLMITKETP